MFVANNPRPQTRAIRQNAYDILRLKHPQKLSASDIAEEINSGLRLSLSSPNYGLNEVTADQVRYALDGICLQSKHFARFPSFSRVLYSVYLLDPPFDALTNCRQKLFFPC